MSASKLTSVNSVSQIYKPRFNWTRLTPFWLLMPTLIVLVVVQLYPTLYSLFISLNKLKGGVLIPVQLDNYTHLLEDTDFIESLGKSGIFVFGTVFLTLAVGMAVAILLNQRSKANGIYLVLLFVPWVVSDVVVGTIWRWLFQQQYGLIQTLIAPLTGSTSLYARPDGAMLIVILATVWRSVPFTSLLFLSSLQNVPHEVLESAALDGASRMATFIRVTFPIISPTFIVAIVLSTIGALNSVGVILTLTGSNPATRTASIYLYKNGWQYGDFGLGAATAVVLFVINMLLTLVYLRFQRSE